MLTFKTGLLMKGDEDQDEEGEKDEEEEEEWPPFRKVRKWV